MKKSGVVGATSAIAEAACRLFADRGDRLYLVGRREKALQQIQEDLVVRGAHRVDYRVLDLNVTSEHKGLLRRADQLMAGIDLLLIAHGTLPEQAACEQSFERTFEEFQTNALSVISILTHGANLFESRATGTIAVVTSVAGDRGRKSNYINGAAKGAVSIFLQGLRNRLYGKGVTVITIKPGFVDTPMTRRFKKGILWASPGEIASGIVEAVDKEKEIVYLPRYWQAIMTIILLIPDSLFKRLSL